MLRETKARAFGIGVGMASVFGLWACNGPSATIYPVRHESLTRVEALTAFPASRAVDGTWTRQCGAGGFDGLLVDIAAVGSREIDATERLVGGLAPGDRVDFVQKLEASSADGLSVTLSCEESVDASGTGCAGWTPDASRAGAAYVPPKGGEAAGPKHVVILIDQSGSTSGLVDASNGNREAQTGDFDIPSSFGSLASDPNNLRLAAARRVLRSVGDATKVCVLAFGEDIDVQIARPDAELATCFGATSIDAWLGVEGIDNFAGSGQGRSPLWRAVDVAWDVLAANAEAGASDHVLVLDDGPDTCTGESFSGCAPCGHAGPGFTDVTARIGSEDVAPVDFIQFAAPGYPDRDARQMQVACATGGQYLFMRGQDDPMGVQAADFMERLERGVIDVIASWDGVWRVALELGQDPPDTARGVMNGLSGEVTVAVSSGMVPEDTRYRFGVLTKADGGEVNWDHRLSLLRACGSPADCGAEAAGACLVVCSGETLLCSDDPAGDPLPDGTSCDGGACCAGACGDAACCSE